MSHSKSAARASRLVPVALTAALGLAACRADGPTGYESGCADQPGCASAAVVEPLVLDALSDASTRIIPTLHASVRATLGVPLDRLHTALTRNDMPGARNALAATYDAIARAENTWPESRADFGVVRLSLVPAARALGLHLRDESVSATQ